MFYAQIRTLAVCGIPTYGTMTTFSTDNFPQLWKVNFRGKLTEFMMSNQLKNTFQGNPDYVPEMYFASIPFFHHWITKTMENAETSLE